MKPTTHVCSFDALVHRISQMTAQEKEAFALRALKLIESAGFERLSTESRTRAWTVLDLCTQ